DVIEILLVEDNPGDIRLTQEAFKEGNLNTNLNAVTDGVKALDYLYKRGEYANVSRPELILLDLNLPKKDGREVLEAIKGDEDLKTIPVIILTTSSSDFDVNRCYDLLANCFITKPIDFDSFMDVILSIESYWLKLASLPSRT
ncbi:UNVERIFIED_CONTAM: hypothetical protein GTU68_014416, partial [Idotea baltica]|nr:hypothetical protein [Idotea baltica]